MPRSEDRKRNRGAAPLTTSRPCTAHRYHSPRPQIRELHHVWPLGMGGPSDGKTVAICSTGHENVHECIRRRLGGTAHRAEYGKAEWDLATEALRLAGERVDD